MSYQPAKNVDNLWTGKREVFSRDRTTPKGRHVREELKGFYEPAARTPGRSHYARQRSGSRKLTSVGSRARTTDIKLGSTDRVLKAESGLRTAEAAVSAAKGSAEAYALNLGRRCAAAKFGHNANAQVSKAMLMALEPSKAMEIGAAAKHDTRKGASDVLPKASVVNAFREGLGKGQITDDAKYALQALVSCHVKDLAKKAAAIAKNDGRVTIKQRDVSLAASLCA